MNVAWRAAGGSRFFQSNARNAGIGNSWTFPEGRSDSGKASHLAGVGIHERHLGQVNDAGRPYAAPEVRFRGTADNGGF